MRFVLRITDDTIEIDSPDPLSMDELKQIFQSLEKRGISIRPDDLAGEDQPLDSKVIKGRLCG